MREKIFQEKCHIVGKQKIGKEYFKLTIDSRKIASFARPGQFVEIEVVNEDGPFLRRPLGIHRVKAGNFDILCEIVGRGTKILSQKKTGEYLDVIGPLGNGFNLLKGKAIIVAGGMGVAPLVFLAEKMVHSKPSVLLGAKTKSQTLCEKEFKSIGCDVKIATDDGSRGFKGKITELLNYLLSTMNYEPSTIYACGPRPMLKEVSRISKKNNIPAQFSLEEHMACGIGACLGCVIDTRDGYKRVCKDGPVFAADDIIWTER
ncbi:MAG: dihydroorotate dehydrogenase electron transfer subunit [Candidatus Omnitrophota bacterium]